ncbi:MAG: hypothetical protein WBD20_17450 [Pirellulaceae bacterium]
MNSGETLPSGQQSPQAAVNGDDKKERVFGMHRSIDDIKDTFASPL